MHDRRHPRARGRRPPRHAHQDGGEGDAARVGAFRLNTTITPRPITPPPDRRVWSERLVRISGFRKFLPTQGSQRSFPFIVLIVTLLIVVLLTWLLTRIINRIDEDRFKQAVDRAHTEIERRVNGAVSIVKATSSLSLWQSLNRETFQTWARLASIDSYRVQSIGYCARFNQRSKEALRMRLEAEYGPGFGLIQRHTNADEGFAVLFVEPFEVNSWAIGWNLFDEKGVRQKAMNAARAEDAPRASRWASLPVDSSLKEKEPGIYVFAPVYAPEAPTATPEERRTALLGFTYCSVLFSTLFDQLTDAITDGGVTFRVYESPPGEEEVQVYSLSTGALEPETMKPVWRTLETHGISWRIEYATQPKFDETPSRGLIPWIAIGGVICCLLLFLATFALTHARMDSERIEGVLREKTMELARSNTDLERFAYVASHDLREPLRMVTSYVQLLEKRYGDKLDADAKEFIGFAVDGATRMNEFLDGLLYLSRVSRDPGVHDPIDSDRALRTAIGNLKHATTSANAVVTADHPLPFARINETHLLQLFQNLIGNAIKFQKDGLPRVHVSSAREGEFVKFSVRDNGIGIDPAFSEQVFEVFRRLHTRDHYPGSGLGLAICKRVVEQRGGRIWFESNAPEPGTTFYFTLPAG